MKFNFKHALYVVVALCLSPNVFSLPITSPSLSQTVFAQGSANSTFSGDVGLTNLDIPSIDFTLPDGSSVSPDFRSIYFNGGSEGQKIYAYYNDYGLPENKPQFKAGGEFTADAYLSHSGTPEPASVQISISKVLSGEGSGNFTAMKLDSPLNLESSGSTYTIPQGATGNYILDTFVAYPFSGVVMVYTIEIQIAS